MAGYSDLPFVTFTDENWDWMLKARWKNDPPVAFTDLGPFTSLVRGPCVIGQLGQSLDGRIATQTGQSHYINRAPALDHLHRLRALADAVVVGVGTVQADNPQLTVRRVAGPNPVRVVLDPRGRVPVTAACLADDAARRILVLAAGTPRPHGLPEGVELLPLPVDQAGRFDPRDVVRALGDLGLTRLLVEGGAATVSAFLAAGALDRLHVLVASLIIGSGIPGLALPAIDHLDRALRPKMTPYTLGQGELLLDCTMRPT